MDAFVLMQADIAYESISDALKPPTTERNYVYSTRLNEVIGPFHAEARLLKHDKKDPQKTLEHIENMRKKIPELRKTINEIPDNDKASANAYRTLVRSIGVVLLVISAVVGVVGFFAKSISSTGGVFAKLATQVLDNSYLASQAKSLGTVGTAAGAVITAKAGKYDYKKKLMKKIDDAERLLNEAEKVMRKAIR